MAVSTKLGTLTPLVYFVNHRDPAHREGYLLVAPYTDCPTPEGYSREEATTLRACYDLQRRLQEQEIENWQRESARDVSQLRERFRQTRERMLARMASSSTTPFDRDFMEAYLQLQEEKLERHERTFECRAAYLHALEYDTPKGRAPDEERVSLDRVNF